MLELITLVKLGIVPPASLPHLPEDLQPTLAQAAERTGVTLTFAAFLLVVSLRPWTLGPAQIGPQVNRVP